MSAIIEVHSFTYARLQCSDFFLVQIARHSKAAERIVYPQSVFSLLIVPRPQRSDPLFRVLVHLVILRENRSKRSRIFGIVIEIYTRLKANRESQ